MPPRFGWYGNDSPLAAAPARRERTDRQPDHAAAPGVSKQMAEEQLHALHHSWREERPKISRGTASTTTLRNYLDITVASGEMRSTLRLLLRRRRLPAADRVRQRGEPATGAGTSAPRDGRADVDRRAAGGASCGNCSPRACCCRSRAGARRVLRVRRHRAHRRVHAGLLRAERGADHRQRSGAALLPGDLGAHRDPLRAGAGTPAVEGRIHRRR